LKLPFSPIRLSIAIGDFGSGCSSLSFLQQLPIDRLKLSRVFVEGVPSNSANNAIVGAIASMGQKLGISLVAEGIETEEQMLFVKEIGCQTGQGFFLRQGITSRPI